MNKERYFNLLSELLREYYNDIKDSGVSSPEHENFINGYLTAARTLNVVYQKEMNEFAEKIHFEVFQMTIGERRESLQDKPEMSEAETEDETEVPVTSESSEEDFLDIPAYKRKGVQLKS